MACTCVLYFAQYVTGVDGSTIWEQGVNYCDSDGYQDMDMLFRILSSDSQRAITQRMRAVETGDFSFRGTGLPRTTAQSAAYQELRTILLENFAFKLKTHSFLWPTRTVKK